MMVGGYKTCPYCGEEIKEEAIKCRYCHEFLDDEENNYDNSSEYSSNEQIKQNITWNDIRRDPKVKQYFLVQPFCPHCHCNLSEWSSCCPECGKRINLSKYHMREDDYGLFYVYDEHEESSKTPFVLCPKCGFLGYAKKKVNWGFRDGVGFGIIQLAVGRVNLKRSKGYICPDCGFDYVYVNKLEQKKFQ